MHRSSLADFSEVYVEDTITGTLWGQTPQNPCETLGTGTPSKTRLECPTPQRSLHCKEVSMQLGRRGVQRCTAKRRKPFGGNLAEGDPKDAQAGA